MKTPRSHAGHRVLFGIMLCGILAVCRISFADMAPEHLVLVVNGKSPASLAIANEYVRLRAVPDSNIVVLDGITNVVDHFLSFDGTPIERAPRHITWDPITAQKGGFRHFLLKEIHEQPQAMIDTMLGRIQQEVRRRPRYRVSAVLQARADSAGGGVERASPGLSPQTDGLSERDRSLP